MSKPIIDIPMCDHNMPAIEKILQILPKYDYDFIDAFGNMPQYKRVICMSEFLFNISKVLIDKYMIKADNIGCLYYKEDGCSIHYGFNRVNHKTNMVTILIKNEDPVQHPYFSYSNTSFFISMEISNEEYNVIKTYILNKCIKNKEYMRKIFYRLYGISR